MLYYVSFFHKSAQVFFSGLSYLINSQKVETTAGHTLGEKSFFKSVGITRISSVWMKWHQW